MSIGVFLSVAAKSLVPWSHPHWSDGEGFAGVCKDLQCSSGTTHLGRVWIPGVIPRCSLSCIYNRNTRIYILLCVRRLIRQFRNEFLGRIHHPFDDQIRKSIPLLDGAGILK